jgi:hypothetical protein
MTVETVDLSIVEIYAISCLYMGHFVPTLNGPCSCPPMSRDLGPNSVRDISGRASTTLKYFGSCHAWPCFFYVLRADPSGPAQMYTYTGGLTPRGAPHHMLCGPLVALCWWPRMALHPPMPPGSGRRSQACPGVSRLSKPMEKRGGRGLHGQHDLFTCLSFS